MGENNQKIAIVLDTNFIIEQKDNFTKTVDNLSQNHFVFVTEISINERVSQKYLEIKNAYDKIENIKKEYKAYATINLHKSFDVKFKDVEKETRAAYEKYFKDRVIKFTSNNQTLNEVLERVYRKVPPFKTAHGSSDKGFKDTLLWMSTMQFFKDYSEVLEIIFITNDKEFLENAELLKTEFKNITQKKIEIKDNNYYKVLLGESTETIAKEEKNIKELSIAQKGILRDRIEETINNICYVYDYDYYGNPIHNRAFEIYKKIEYKEAQEFFENLNDTLGYHIFDKYIEPSIAFGQIVKVLNKNNIPIVDLEKAYELYKIIKTEYAEYIIPFLNTVCEIINRNYEEDFKYVELSDDDELPF
jgi:hypothetical protein